MGVDCCVYLPPRVRIVDVTDVLGVLAGFNKRKRNFPSGDGWYVVVNEVSYRCTGLPELAYIILPGIGLSCVGYLFEPETPEPSRLVIHRKTEIWSSLANALIEFFGGSVDYDNCDDIEIDRHVTVGTVGVDVAPKEGEQWQKFQQAIYDLKPVVHRV